MRSQMFGMALRGSRGGGGLGTLAVGNVVGDTTATSPSSATCRYTLESDGDSNEGGLAGKWLIGSTSGSLYEAKVTVTSGSLSAGTTGSWLALSSNRTWSVIRSSLGTSTCTFTIEVGLAGTSTALDSATVTLTATVDPPDPGGGE